LLNQRDGLEKFASLLLGTESHDSFDAGAVIPTAVEDHDFAGGGKMLNVTLHVHLRFFALTGRGPRRNAKHAGANALSNGFDGAALARAVATFEYDADFEPLVLDPLLQLDKLDVQAVKLALILLAF